jgi:hypothetical protein
VSGAGVGAHELGPHHAQLSLRGAVLLGYEAVATSSINAAFTSRLPAALLPMTPTPKQEAHCISEWVSCLLSTPWPLVYAHDRLGHVRCVADVVNCLSSVCDPDPCCLPACPSNIGVPSVPPALTLTPVQGHDFRCGA